MKQHIQLTPHEAIVLQQVSEDVEDSTWSLARNIGISRQYTLRIISHLQQKGLVVLESNLDGLWVRLTRKGHQLMRYMWPEARQLSQQR